MLQLYNSPQQVFKHTIFVIGNLDESHLTYSYSGPFFNMLEFVGNVLNPSVQPYLFSPYIGKWYFECLPVFQSFQSHWICTRDSWITSYTSKIILVKKTWFSYVHWWKRIFFRISSLGVNWFMGIGTKVIHCCNLFFSGAVQANLSLIESPKGKTSKQVLPFPQNTRSLPQPPSIIQLFV